MPGKIIKEIKKSIDVASHDELCRELLRFLSRHPYTRFNRPVLLDISGFGKIDRTDAALEYLVKIGFVDTNPVAGLFWITSKEPVHSMLISEFAAVNTPPLAGKSQSAYQPVVTVSSCQASVMYC